jgi:hypothetical protein
MSVNVPGARLRWLGNPEVVQVTHVSTPPPLGALGKDTTVVDPLAAAVECSNLHALHFVERLHWPRLQSVGTRRSRRKATTLHFRSNHLHVGL